MVLEDSCMYLHSAPLGFKRHRQWNSNKYNSLERIGTSTVIATNNRETCNKKIIISTEEHYSNYFANFNLE